MIDLTLWGLLIMIKKIFDSVGCIGGRCFTLLLTLCIAACGGIDQHSSSALSESSAAVSSVNSAISSSSIAVVSSSAAGCEEAVARGKALYDDTHACAFCHGAKGEGGFSKAIDLTAALYRHSTMEAGSPSLPLHEYIATYMPAPGNVCTGQCADDVAAYTKSLGGQQWCPSSNNHASSSVAASNQAPAPQANLKVVSPRMRRMNRTEYNNTVRDLFATQSRPGDNFLADVRGKDGHYLKDGSVQSVTIEDAERFFAAAERVVLEAINKNLPALQCATQNAACVDSILSNFGTHVWRRPLTASEKNTLQGIFTTAQNLGNNFDDSLFHVLRTMLLSPNFMYLLEVDATADARALNGYELAARLSYFLWSSTPDAQLLQLAASGALLQEDTLRSQVKRMLADPRAETLVSEFAAQWLQYAKRRSTPDAQLFANYSEELRAAMDEETRTFVNHLISTNAPISELLTANYSFLNGRLKAFYQVDASLPNSGAQPIKIEAEQYAMYMDNSAGNDGGELNTDDVDIEITADEGGGYNVGYTSAGEWLEYNLSIAVAGPYAIAPRIASMNGGGVLNFEIDGVLVSEDAAVPSTGDWQVWQTLAPVALGNLAQGEHTLRVNIVSGGFNLNWLQIAPGGLGARNFERHVWNSQPRQGLLGHASVLTATSNNTATSPVVRGVWVLETLLCDAPPPPPPELPIGDPDEIADSAMLSTRQKFEMHGQPQCRSCHRFVDPIGFGLENYDPIGQWRSQEWRGIEGNGPWAVDATGTLPTGESFDGGVELSDILASSYRLPMCFTSHIATYGLGRNVKGFLPGDVQSSDYPLVFAIYQKTQANGHRFQDIIEELVVSDAFRQRASSAGE